jgi:DegV family protein with EDD domain
VAASCILIVDSCCDLPFELVDRPQVELVRFPYFFGNEEHLDDMFHTADAQSFYGRMRAGETPTTAQVSLVVLEETFRKCAASGQDSVYLSFSSGLSGSFDKALLIRDKVCAEYPDATIEVVDTHLASTGEALLIYEALRRHEQGAGAAELASWAREAQHFVNVFFMVDNLDALQRGGRIPASVAFAGSKLDVKPILMIPDDGTLSIKTIVRGRKKGLKTLAQLYRENAASYQGASDVCVGNADCPDDMVRLEKLVAGDGDVHFVETSIGPVIGCHVGPGMVSLVFWGRDKRPASSVSERIAQRIRSNR